MKMYLSQNKAAGYLNVAINTFTKYIPEKYPPDRKVGNRFEWHQSTLDKIRADPDAFTKNQ